MEIRRAARQPSQDRTFESSHVLPESRDHGATWVSGRLYLVGGLVLQRDNWQVTDIQRTGQVADSDVQRRGHGMIAYVGRIVTSATRAGDGRKIQVIVKSGDPGDVDRLRIEQGLAPRNTRALLLASQWGLQIRPGVEQLKDHGCEWRAVRVSA